MFRRDVKTLSDLIMRNLRTQGLETPLLQRRLIAAWPEVAGPMVARYTTQVVIRNQTLYVSLVNAALRADLTMNRMSYVKQLNDIVQAQIIVDIRFV
ncbi:MAG: DUF721 domain-containing protein [Prevotella sp.]